MKILWSAEPLKNDYSKYVHSYIITARIADVYTEVKVTKEQVEFEGIDFFCEIFYLMERLLLNGRNCKESYWN